jgi:hypothetical protein
MSVSGKKGLNLKQMERMPEKKDEQKKEKKKNSRAAKRKELQQ